MHHKFCSGTFRRPRVRHRDVGHHGGPVLGASPRDGRCCFAVPLGLLQFVTTFWFNPLSTNLDHIYESELAQAVLSVKSKDRTG